VASRIVNPLEVLEFKITNPPDPFTEDYWLPPKDPGKGQLAKCSGYYRLWNAIERYTMWESAGRSFLISGNRGSGKTTMVESVIEDVRQNFLQQDAGRRPLFVRVHGPDLFPKPAAKPEKEEAKPAPGVLVQVSGLGDGAASKPEANGASALDKDPLLEHVLKQIVISLYRSVANEYAVSYRERIRRRGVLPPWQEAEFYESSAQFAHDLEECPELAELRDYWERIGLLRSGVLFARPEPKKADQGALEIVALSMVAQAYRVISGTWEDKRTEDATAASSRQLTLATATEVKNLLAPLAGLLAGGAVAWKIPGLNGVLAGLLSALAISFSFSYSSTRSRDNKRTRSSTYAKDRTVSSLGRILPQLVTQFRRTGLHPVFVVDELDKVKDLDEQMKGLISYLKDFASDRALFCFLTDRDYLEYIERRTANNKYVPEYSYFREHIPVAYQPEDLRIYLKSVFQSNTSAALQPGGPLQADYELLMYSLLHRARLHPLDLRRELSNLGGREGVVRITLADLREGPRVFELVIQLAVERALSQPDLQDAIRGSARLAQLAMDALYYASRSWAKGEETLDIRDQAIIDYLETRMNPTPDDDAANAEAAPDEQPAAPKEEKPAPPEPPVKEPKHPPRASDSLSPRDRKLLAQAAKQVVRSLENPAALVEQIKVTRGANGPSNSLLEMVPTSDRFKLLKKLQSEKYKWRFNTYGQLLEAPDLNQAVEGTAEDRALIQRIDAQLLDWTDQGAGLGLFAAQTGLPALTPVWASVRAGIDRISRLEQTDPDLRTPYKEMADDANCIQDYAAKLRSRGDSIAQALCCMSALTTGFIAPSAAEQALQALRALSSELNIKGSNEDLPTKFNGMYRTLRDCIPDLPEQLAGMEESPQDWITETTAQLAIAKKLPFDMRQREWNRWLGRFSVYLQKGVQIFESAFEDAWTRVDMQPPIPWDKPSELRPKLYEIRLADWSNMYLRAMKPAARDLPAWLAVPASTALGPTILSVFTLGLPGMAADFPEPSLHAEWVRVMREFNDTKRASLLVARDEHSLTAEWSSGNNLVMYVTAGKLWEMADALASVGISSPADIHIDRIFIELAGDAASLATALKNPPAANLPPGAFSSAFVKAALALPCIYILPEQPVETTEKTTIPYVIAPASVDDLIGKLPPETTGPAGQRKS
jgi:hypothetical protein